MCFSSFHLSRVRARTFPLASLPAGVQTYYAVTLAVANDLLAAHFPATGPGSNFDVVPFDIEYHGSPPSSRAMRLLPVPLPQNGEHFLRLLTIVRDGVVIVFDLWAIGVVPPRLAEILADQAIVKVGVGDSVFCTRHYAIPVYNGWEISQLWKCMHPHIEFAPLTSHISVDDMARLTLGVRVDKAMQNSAWNATFLTVDQINYAILDAYILLPIYRAVRRQFDLGTWPLFTTASFAFNVDLVQQGAVVQPGPGTVGTAIRVWGVGMPIPGVNDGDWAPAHPILDRYRAGLYNDCRSTAFALVIRREARAGAAALGNIAFFSSYRLCRWLSVNDTLCAFVLTIIVVPAAALYFYYST